VYEALSDSSDEESLVADMDSEERELYELVMTEMINLENGKLVPGETI
jgi:hypothetical protein